MLCSSSSCVLLQPDHQIHSCGVAGLLLRLSVGLPQIAQSVTSMCFLFFNCFMFCCDKLEIECELARVMMGSVDEHSKVTVQALEPLSFLQIKAAYHWLSYTSHPLLVQTEMYDLTSWADFSGLKAGALIWHGRDLRRYKRLLSPPLQRLLTCPGTAALGRGVASMPASYAHQVSPALQFAAVSHSLTRLFIHCLYVQSYILFIHSCTHPFIHPFVRPFVHPSINPFVCPCIHCFICIFSQP